MHQLPAWQLSLVVQSSPQPSRKAQSRVLASHSSLGWHWPDDSQFSQNDSAVQTLPSLQSSRLVHSGGRPASTTPWLVFGQAQSARATATQLKEARVMAAG